MSRDGYAFMWGSLPMVLTVIGGGIIFYWGYPVESYDRIGFFLVGIPLAIIFGFRRGAKMWERRRQPVTATVVSNPLPAPPKPRSYVKVAALAALATAIVTSLLIWWIFWLQSL